MNDLLDICGACFWGSSDVKIPTTCECPRITARLSLSVAMRSPLPPPSILWASRGLSPTLAAMAWLLWYKISLGGLLVGPVVLKMAQPWGMETKR